MKNRCLILLMALLLVVGNAFAQKKTGQKTQTGKKPPAKAQSSGKGQKSDKPQAGSIPVEQIETMRQQAGQMVNFFASTLNFLADKRNPVKEKEVIINDSYIKIFWDSEVQVEDDLDDGRMVPLYKDIQAYLSDVDFFFRRAKFIYTVQDASIQTSETGQTFIRVTANRNIVGQTVNGDSVNSNKVRYFEIDYDDAMQQIKIVSIYTTKLNQREDMRNWWNGLSEEWHQMLGKDIFLGDDITLADISRYNDTVATVANMPQPIDAGQFYRQLAQIINKKEIDLSGNVSIADLEPLGKMSELTSVNLSGTPVSDLLPLRNLNKLEVLNIAGTPVSALEPLKYCNRIKSLNLKGTQITDITLVAGFPGLNELDISRTGVTDITPLKEITTLQMLKLAGIQVHDLESLRGLLNLEVLDISGTQVSSLDPLTGMKKLTLLMADGAPVTSVAPLSSLYALQKVYCDNCNLPRQEAVAFMRSHPGTTVIFASTELTSWWSNMPDEWKKVFNLYQNMDNFPSKEQLHRLMLIDSINVNGRLQITSLNPLMELAGLRTLQFANTAVQDVMPLKGLTLLKYINANNTKVTDIGPLAPLKRLEAITLDNTGVSDLDPLNNFNDLKIIYADNSKVTLPEANAYIDANPNTLVIFQTFENSAWWKNLSQAWKDIMLQQLNLKGAPDKIQLQQIANLEQLTINENTSLTDLTPVLYLSRLKELTFTGTAVSMLDPLARMNRLQVLRCSRNPIVLLEPLSALKSLKELDISNTQVEDLTPIQGLIQLEVLKFSGTPVKKLKPIIGLTNMRVIEFYNTKVSGMDELDQMRKLESVKIFNTKISSKKVDKFKIAHPGCEVVFY